MIKVKTKPDFETNRLKYFYDATKEKKFTDVFFTVGNRRYHYSIPNLICSENINFNQLLISVFLRT